MHDIRDILAHLHAGNTLSEAIAHDFFTAMLAGRLEPAHMAAALALLATRTPTDDELTAGARVMRDSVTPVPIPAGLSGNIIDTCGTGGTPKTFNVGTLAAIVAAAAAPGQLRVAKHGNRSRTGRGSAEVLQGLGVNVNASPQVQARCLIDTGVCFCFAIHHHPAMKHVAPVRQALGFPTIFNALGPLTNPARAQHQVMGVYKRDLVMPVARTLARLGCQRAWVLHSHDGLDELTVTAPVHIAEVTGPAVREWTFTATDYNIPRATMADLQADSLDDAVGVAHALLEGQPGPKRDMLLLASAAALIVGGVVTDMPHALALAAQAIDSGAAQRTLTRLAEISHTS
ncbi:MAG: anthranilate phosphoribosyltransferase [Phycisphaerae bacterium]|jgi:anthranilate phosphoribosyltransferase